MFRNIRLAIAIVKCAADAIKDNMMMMLVPPIMCVFVAILWILWTYGIMCFYSTGTIVKNANGPYAEVTLSDE